MKAKWNFMNIDRTTLSFRKKVVLISFGLAIGCVSLWFTSSMARQLREKENYEVRLWALAIERLGQFNADDPLSAYIMDSRNNIPFIRTTDNFSEVLSSNLIPDRILYHPDLLSRKLEQLARENPPLEITAWNGSRFYIFYGNSRLQKTLTVFPFVQLAVIVIFIGFGFLTFRSSQEDEQNKVWIGLAKETAHQLGTPISSLLGWIEYLKTQHIDPSVVEEMNKDLTRLMKVADRFSKIGSETVLSPANVNEVVGSSVMYFRTRIPRNVTLSYNGLAIAPVQAMINGALFEWVVENLLKNSLDALQGQGEIDVRISDDLEWVYIDVKDTGKGIPKSNFKRIFEPGFTTKTRGDWGSRLADASSRSTTRGVSMWSIPNPAGGRPYASPLKGFTHDIRGCGGYDGGADVSVRRSGGSGLSRAVVVRSGRYGAACPGATSADGFPSGTVFPGTPCGYRIGSRHLWTRQFRSRCRCSGALRHTRYFRCRVSDADGTAAVALSAAGLPCRRSCGADDACRLGTWRGGETPA